MEIAKMTNRTVLATLRLIETAEFWVQQATADRGETDRLAVVQASVAGQEQALV